jgi:hypothetical protein
MLWLAWPYGTTAYAELFAAIHLDHYYYHEHTQPLQRNVPSGNTVSMARVE